MLSCFDFCQIVCHICEKISAVKEEEGEKKKKTTHNYSSKLNIFCKTQGADVSHLILNYSDGEALNE